MLSLNDIINASFRKSGFSGYRTDDVDHFIDQVKESYDALVKASIEQKEEHERLRAENEQLTDKIKILAQKIEDYRAEEEEIKNALVSAQKLGDAAVRESRHKAEIIIKDANLKAERVVANANLEIVEQKKEMERLQKSVADFRSNLLNMYKEHLTLINALPIPKADAKPEEPLQPQPVVPVHEEPAAEQSFAESFQSEEPADDDTQEPLFRAEVSTFDDAQAFESVPGRYTAIQFGNESEMADRESTSGI